jgi:hypothetical protein
MPPPASDISSARHLVVRRYGEYVQAMSNERSRSPELDQVRRLLFPNLAPAEGWARIDAALEGASDPDRIDAIERLAGSDLSGDLLAVLRRLRDDENA